MCLSCGLWVLKQASTGEPVGSVLKEEFSIVILRIWVGFAALGTGTSMSAARWEERWLRRSRSDRRYANLDPSPALKLQAPRSLLLNRCRWSLIIGLSRLSHLEPGFSRTFGLNPTQLPGSRGLNHPETAYQRSTCQIRCGAPGEWRRRCASSRAHTGFCICIADSV